MLPSGFVRFWVTLIIFVLPLISNVLLHHRLPKLCHGFKAQWQSGHAGFRTCQHCRSSQCTCLHHGGRSSQWRSEPFRCISCMLGPNVYGEHCAASLGAVITSRVRCKRAVFSSVRALDQRKPNAEKSKGACKPKAV